MAPAIFNKETLIPIGVATLIAVPVCTFLIWLCVLLAEIKTQLALINQKMAVAVTQEQFRWWAARLADKNVSINVPPVDPPR